MPLNFDFPNLGCCECLGLDPFIPEGLVFQPNAKLPLSITQASV